MEPRRHLRPLRLATLLAAALGLWALAFGSLPDDPTASRGPADALLEAASARPWVVFLAALCAAWLGIRGLAGAPVSRRRLAVAVVLVAASLVPAVPDLAHWTLYGAFGVGAVAATVLLFEALAPGLSETGRAGRAGRAGRRSLSFPGLVGAAATLHLVLTLTLCFLLFGGVPHVQDSVAQLFQARIFLAGGAAAPVPPAPAAFEYSHMVVHAGRWFAIYPPGHALLLALGLALGLPQVVNPLAGAVALVGTALLARDLLGERAARWALLLTLISPFWILMHAGFMSHATTHAALVWAVYGWRRGAVRSAPRVALGAGALFGLAFAIRPYTAVLVGLALVGAALAGRRRQAVVACAWTAVGALPGVALTLGYNALTTGDPLLFGYVARFGELHMPGFHPAPWGPPHTPARGLVHVLADLNGLNRYLLAWPVPFTVLLGAAAAAGWRVREAWPIAVPVALLAGHFAYWYADFCFGPRMVFESFFALAILGAGALDFLHRSLRRRLLLVAAVAIAGSIPLWGHLLSVFGDAYWGVDDIESRAVAAAAPEDAVVLVTGNYGGYLWRNDPHLESGPLYVRHRDPATNRAVAAAFPDRPLFVEREGELIPVAPRTGPW